MKKKIIFICLGVFFLTVVITFIVKFTLDIQKTNKLNEEKVIVINDAYDSLSKNITNFNTKRDEIGEIFSNFVYTEVNEKMPSWKNTFTEYEKIIEAINVDVSKLKDNCTMIFKDSNVNTKCNTYKDYYQQIFNLFENDVNSFNTSITNYNQEAIDLEEYQEEELIKFEVERIEL